MSVIDIPESPAPRPKQPVKPFADLQARLAAAGFTGETVKPDEPWRSHAEFERETNAEGKSRYRDPTDCSGTLRFADRTGVLWPAVCDVCGFEVGVSMFKTDPEFLLRDRLGRAGLPERFAGKEFERGDPQQEPTLDACRQYIKGFARGRLPGVLLWGKPGRGKSHLLTVILDTLIRKHGVEGLYRTMQALNNELRAGARDGSFDAVWQRALNAPVLVLDDLGAERLTDATREWFGALLDHRWSKELPVLGATNVPPVGWERAFDERAASRLRGLCVALEVGGRDRRAQQQLGLGA